MKKAIFFSTVIFLLTLFAVNVFAAQNILPHSFSSDTPAYADSVNENFEALETAIVENQIQSTAALFAGRVIYDMEAANGLAQIAESITIGPVGATTEDCIVTATIVDEISAEEPEDLQVGIDFGDRGNTSLHTFIVRRIDGANFAGNIADDTLTVDWIAVCSTNGFRLPPLVFIPIPLSVENRPPVRPEDIP
jgi:hypothetical protein